MHSAWEDELLKYMTNGNITLLLLDLTYMHSIFDKT